MTFYEQLRIDGAGTGESLVQVERGEDRATVTMADPAKLNVLSAPLVLQLRAALEELAGDRAIRAIVITGRDPGFSAGGDLRMMEEAPQALSSPQGVTDIWRWIPLRVRGHRATDRQKRHGVPRRDQRRGGGRGARVGAHLRPRHRLGSSPPGARLRASGPAARGGNLVGHNPTPGLSGCLRLLRRRRGARRRAGEGAWASCTRWSRHARLLAAADDWCTRIAALPPHAIAMTKPLLRAAADGTWESALAMEEFAEPQCFTTAAFQDAVAGLLSSR